MYPPTISEIVQAAHRYKLFNQYFKDKPVKGKYSKISPKFIDDV
jgi:hypothetical protein